MIIKNKNKIIASKVFVCKSFLERLKGLMFKKLNKDEACLLINPYESILDAGIHMMFVPQSLDIIWLDKYHKVVSIKKCPKPNLLNWWKIYYPKKPAKYVVELLDKKNIKLGDKITLSSP